MHEVITALAQEALVAGGLAVDFESASQKVQQCLDSGAALECFEKMVALLGGPADFVARYDSHYLAKAAIIKPAYLSRAGYITGMDTRQIGMAAVALGGGRSRAADNIDFSVGFSDFAKVGALVGPKEPIAWVHAQDEASASRAIAALKAAIEIGSEAPEQSPVVIQKIK